MSKPLITVGGETPAKGAIKLMVEKDIGALVVTEKGKPVGIVTERDVLKKCCPETSCREVKVSEIMSSPLARAYRYFESKVEVPRIRVGKRQTLETLINEEALQFAKFIRNERNVWRPRVANIRIKL